MAAAKPKKKTIRTIPQERTKMREQEPAVRAKNFEEVALGYSKDTPLEWIYRYARQARLVDGASEVHRAVVARHLAENADAFFDWNHLDRPKAARKP